MSQQDDSILVSWEIDVFPDDAELTMPDNPTPEQKALVSARYIQQQHFKPDTLWTFQVTVDGKKYEVDLATDSVKELPSTCCDGAGYCREHNPGGRLP